MSDTVSDLASRAQAREEVAEPMVAAVRKTLDDFADVFGLLIDTDAFARQIVSDSLADFARLAGLLGYVKADVTGVENGVRHWEGDPDREGGQWERVIDDFESDHERRGFYRYVRYNTERRNELKPGHRLPELVTRPTVNVPWEVVDRAES